MMSPDYRRKKTNKKKRDIDLYNTEHLINWMNDLRSEFWILLWSRNKRHQHRRSERTAARPSAWRQRRQASRRKRKRRRWRGVKQRKLILFCQQSTEQFGWNSWPQHEGTETRQIQHFQQHINRLHPPKLEIFSCCYELKRQSFLLWDHLGSSISQNVHQCVVSKKN